METIIVGLLSVAGTLVGSVCGIIASNKTVDFRLKKLEQTLDSYGKIGERVAVLEAEIDLVKLDLQILKQNVRSGNNETD